MMVVSASHASPLRAVHVGVAGRGEWPLRLMAADERWRSVGLVDVNTDNLARACTMTGLATDACFPDLAEALRAVPADAVVVVTPSALHGRFIRLALEAGKHVLVEKPFVHQLAEAEELVALAEAQHRQIVVAQQYRFNVQQRALHAALASGEFGTPGYATMVHHRRRPDPRAFTMPHAMLVEMSVLALLGIRYPLRMLPILLFEVAWKLTWLGVIALPLWSDNKFEGATREQAGDVLWVLIIIAVIPWRQVLTQYVMAPGEPWRRSR